MNLTEIYSQATKPDEEIAKEQAAKVQLASQQVVDKLVDEQARNAWLKLPATQQFLAKLKELAQNCNRKSCENAGISVLTDIEFRAISIENHTLNKVINYAISSQYS